MTRDALKDLTIAPEASVREALEAIDRSKRRIAPVVSEDGRLVATVTDGDVRRGILQGVDLDGQVSRVMRSTPTTVTDYFDNGEIYVLSPEALDQLTPGRTA